MNSLAAQRFAALTSRLGVEEVRCESKCVVIFVRRDATDDDLDAVRVLALAEWHGSPVFVGRRISIRESGIRPIVHLVGAARGASAKTG